MKNLTSIQPSTSRLARLAALKQSFQEWSSAPDMLTRLSRRLSTTLCLETQLGMIAEEVAETIPFDAMNYRHRIARQDFVFATGVGGPHRCEYRLSIEGNYYGTLSFHRRQKFTEDELAGFEMLISAVICPLRNACRFIAIEQTALTDSLTGIGNKRAMDEDLLRASALAARHGAPWSLILCDLDHFKRVNDTHGHMVGDHILTRAAEQIERSLRTSDTVYRFGGEEFAVLLPHTDEQAAKDVADRIRMAIEGMRVDTEDALVSVSASCGVARYLNGEDFGHWLARADEALYRAKDHGRNCTRVFATIT
ncbi:MAG: GGDEF domain-containing protein [Marinobacter sp.]